MARIVCPGGKPPRPGNLLTPPTGVRILRPPIPARELLTNRSGGYIGFDLDVADVAEAYERRLHEACPEHRSLAMRVFDRLPPTRWTLEWYLPWWLAQAVGLDPAMAREIVLSNVLGLGSIRLQDDLADGDLDAEEVAGARVLAAAMYDLALEPYRGWFGPTSPFWRHLETRMAAWREAGDGEPGSPSLADPASIGHREDLAARGAPLHIAAVAVCLLADRMDVYPGLEGCLDRALEALVLYDHVADWEADLDGGRWNAFVAASSPGPQLAETRDCHRAATYVAMLTGDPVEGYFGRIDDALLRAAAIADGLDPAVPQLAEHLRTFAVGVRSQGAAITERYRDLGDQAAKLLFPGPTNARS